MSKFITPKRMFYLETTGFIVTRVLLLGGSSLLSMQFMQLTYAIGTSIKAIYYCYVYLIFEREYYGIVTGVVWGASALGTCVSGVLGQILVNDGVSYLVLNYISMGSVCVAFVLAFFIPDAKYESLTSATTMTDDDGDVVVDTSTINGDKGDCESSGNIAIENIITATFPDSFEDDVNDRPSGTGGYYNNVANTITAEYMQSVQSIPRQSRTHGIHLDSDQVRRGASSELRIEFVVRSQRRPEVLRYRDCALPGMRCDRRSISSDGASCREGRTDSIGNHSDNTRNRECFHPGISRRHDRNGRSPHGVLILRNLRALLPRFHYRRILQHGIELSSFGTGVFVCCQFVLCHSDGNDRNGRAGE